MAWSWAYALRTCPGLLLENAGHDVEILSNARKLTELGIGLSVARVDLDSLRERMTQVGREPAPARLCVSEM